MTKALRHVFILLFGLLLAVVLAEIRPVQAASTVPVTVARGAASRVQTVTQVYDLTAVAQRTAALSALQTHLQGLDETQVASYIAQHHLPKVTAFTMTGLTSTFTAAPDHTYLLVQTRPVMHGGSEWVAPMVFSTRAAPLTVTQKPIATWPAAYFYKYGQDQETGKTGPLAGATFALRRQQGAGWQYLTNRGTWRSTLHPLADAQVAHFVSDAQGLVLADVTLAAGDYQFTELATRKGYTITAAAKAIAVHVAASGGITVRGAPLPLLQSDRVPAGASRRADLRVYNIKALIPHQPNGGGTTPPGGQTQPPAGQKQPPRHPFLWLPQTGEAVANLLLAGLALILVAIVLWHRTMAHQKAFKS